MVTEPENDRSDTRVCLRTCRTTKHSKCSRKFLEIEGGVASKAGGPGREGRERRQLELKGVGWTPVLRGCWSMGLAGVNWPCMSHSQSEASAGH